MSLYASGNQTVGPYLHIGLEWLTIRDLAGESIKGSRVSVEGRVVDGDGKGVGDALIEIWQANAEGKYAHPQDAEHEPRGRGFRGFGRIPTDADGRFSFTTIKPGRVAGPDGKLQAPHLVVSVFMRGLLKHLMTRIYFPDEGAVNELDPILGRVPAMRRATLVAKDLGKGALQWNVILQGEHETVFFDF